jgi:hypothetical protein
MPDRSIDRRSLATYLMLAAGGLALASWAVHWASFTFPRTPTEQITVHVGHRGIGLWFGIILLIRGIASRTVKDERASRRIGVLSVISGGVLIGFALFDLFTERSHVIQQLIDNTVRQSGVSATQVASVIHAQEAAGVLRITFTGAWLALAAGILALAASVLSYTRAPAQRDATGWTADAEGTRSSGLTGIDGPPPPIPPAAPGWGWGPPMEGGPPSEGAGSPSEGPGVPPEPSG